MTRHLIQSLRQRWACRPGVNLSLPLMPTWCLVAHVVFSTAYTAYLAWVLSRVLPAYFEAATQAAEFGLQGTVLTVQIVLIATAAWGFGEILSICRAELRKRLLE